jgi:hypothetical protein
MLAHSHTKARKRGIGTVLATIVFVFIMVFTTGNLLVWSIIQASNYQIVADQMRDVDFNRQIESVRITDVVFGGSNRFTAGASNTTTSTRASDWLVSNMNLSSSNGWTFKKIMPSGVNTGFSEGFDPFGAGTGAIGSPSGPGVLLMGFSYNQSVVQFKGNWSTNFYFDPSQYTSSGYIGGTAGKSAMINASWAHHVPYRLYNEAIQDITLKLILINQTGKNHIIDSKRYTSIADSDIAWNYTRNIIVMGNYTGNSLSGSAGSVPQGFWGRVGSPQWITLTMSVVLNVKIGTVQTEFKVYFDDVGLKVNYRATTSTTDYRFYLSGVSRGLVLRMDPSVATSYSLTNVHQIVYLFDSDSVTWVPISNSFVSQTALNITTPITGSNIPKFVNLTNVARIRVYTAHLDSYTATSSSVSLRFLYSDANKISIILENTGALTSRAVSLWIIDSNGHNNFNSTTSTRFGLYVPAGSSGVNATLSFTWTRGVNTIRVVTERGNLVTFQTTA